MSITTAFLNCHNLYEPRQHRRRGPRSRQTFDAKVKALARTLLLANGGRAPDLIGLCEVATRAAAEELAKAIKTLASRGTNATPLYDVRWSGVPAGDAARPQTGLALCVNTLTLDPTGREGLDPPQVLGRHKWFAVELASGRVPTNRFWVVVNHWTSDYRRTPQRANALRTTSAREIGEFFATHAGSAEAAMLIGDFNCEPYASPFTGQTKTDRLFAVRERELVLRDRNRLFYVYNAMWRLLGEPYAFADTTASPPFRPLGTYAVDKVNQRDWRVLDHLLVSKRMMEHGPATFREATLCVVPAVARASDHCAFAATFDWTP